MSSKFLSALLLSFAAILFITSCSKKTNTQGRYIPSNAAIVLHVNTESILEKLPWEEIKQNDLFIKLYSDSSLASFVKSAMDNPENTGIDTKKDMIFFMEKDSSGGYLAFEGTVKDAAKFKSYNAAALKNATASEKNGIQFLVSDRTTVSWDKDKFIVIADVPEVSRLNDLDKIMKDDSLKVELQKLPSTRDGIATASVLYGLAEDKSLAENEKFSELMNNKGDMHFWANSEAIYQGTPNTPGMAAFGMLNISKLYQGSFSAGTVQFDKGKIDVKVKSYTGKELTDLIKKYSGTKINSDMVKRLPAKDVAVFLAMNFKPEGIKEFAKLIGIDGLINMGTSSFGFTLDDFVKANKGDIVFSISDIAKDTSGKTNAAILFAASKGDQASFEKLVAAGKKFGGDQLGTGAPNFHFNQDDKYFSIGNKKEYTDQFVAKEGGSKFDFFDKIASGPIGGYVNLQYILASLRDEAGKDSLGLAALDASLKIWETIIMNGGEFKDGGINQHVEINLVDKTTNSLKQLNKYAAVMANIVEQKKKQDEMMGIKLHGDTTGVKDSLLVQ